MNLLDEIERLLRRPLEVPVKAPPPALEARKRGRPVTTKEWERPIREMSSRQLIRNDLVEVAQNYPAEVARTRVESLDSGRTKRTILARQAATKSARAARIGEILRILWLPESAEWAGHPNSKLAFRLSGYEQFAGLNPDTLRKDIAEAKIKLARHT